jgi:HEAT repeat protein
MLGELAYFPARKMLIQVLAEKGRERIDIIGNAIFDSRWYVVRNAALILGEIRNTKGLLYLKKALEHFDDRVRWEAVVAIEKLEDPKALEMLAPLLSDDAERIRRKVVSVLSSCKYRPALEDIKKAITAPSFKDLDYDEQKELLRALAVIGGEEGLPILERILRRRSLFASGKKDKQKELALLAISAIDSPRAGAILTEVAERKKGALSNLAALVLEKRERASESRGEGKHA